MDWSYVNVLLDVIHKCATGGPQFSGLAKQATQELLDYAANPVPAEEPTDDE